MSVFICPVCGKELVRVGPALRCGSGHSFDLSAEGYVNLMPPGKGSAQSGDSPEMMAARSRFLNAGYYDCLQEAVAQTVAESLQEILRETQSEPLVVDAGCGEGYYTAAVARRLETAGIPAAVSGIDISKRGVRAAAKRGSDALFAVAGIFDLPYASGSAEVLLSIFAPLCEKEFLRVLAPGGRLIVVTPGRDHLFGLKQAVYDKPYRNDEQPYCPEGFLPAGRTVVRGEITVKGSLIRDLFLMTPYFWNTPKEQAARLDALETLDTPVEFIITSLARL